MVGVERGRCDTRLPPSPDIISRLTTSAALCMHLCACNAMPGFSFHGGQTFPFTRPLVCIILYSKFRDDPRLHSRQRYMYNVFCKRQLRPDYLGGWDGLTLHAVVYGLGIAIFVVGRYAFFSTLLWSVDRVAPLVSARSSTPCRQVSRPSLCHGLHYVSTMSTGKHHRT